MASNFEKDKSKIRFLLNIDMLLMVEKDIREGICHSIYQYTKDNIKYMTDYDKNKESILRYKSFIQLENVTKASNQKY